MPIVAEIAADCENHQNTSRFLSLYLEKTITGGKNEIHCLISTARAEFVPSNVVGWLAGANPHATRDFDSLQRNEFESASTGAVDYRIDVRACLAGPCARSGR
jgi:predicted secreted Zn-dependent protease